MFGDTAKYNLKKNNGDCNYIKFGVQVCNYSVRCILPCVREHTQPYYLGTGKVPYVYVHDHSSKQTSMRGRRPQTESSRLACANGNDAEATATRASMATVRAVTKYRSRILTVKDSGSVAYAAWMIWCRKSTIIGTIQQGGLGACGWAVHMYTCATTTVTCTHTS